MEVTDRHFRALARLISRRATLYTEMVVDRTLIHNERLRSLSLELPDLPAQQPVVLQLGGSDPAELECAARYAAQHGYDEVNLNCGCPSPKVAGKGCFGAALMREPHLVADACRRMREVLPEHVPVTVKCRIGVDNDDSYQQLCDFVSVVSERGGVSHFIVHARKAILGGLSPAQNRTIPPLRYQVVYDLIRDFPHLSFSINGGLHTVEDVNEQLKRGVYGVMIGRAVMNRPWHALCDVDHAVYGDGVVITRRGVLERYVEYAKRETSRTCCSSRVLFRPLLNLFHGEKNGKKYRRLIDEGLKRNEPFERILREALDVLPSSVLDAIPPSLSAPAQATEKEHGVTAVSCVSSLVEF
ncbi:tRNA-dihydrouridine(20/20a) synthase [Gracilariopsis chorda]|uniref:tRNA-dihydrouridine(20/20a) synthase n=1 Tax=Gracilariopsis chorda TaxID=448386 RepID=A0A2V3IQ37_9FLOR|nr:tRNA-dihydrouridine(20/20a) synthase [Gracilariopsis chorda]|eukprot:PXF44196.1 tRNA-dihydrouridine(20/20a) synthase [Gracilariopsis chorda]